MAKWRSTPDLVVHNTYTVKKEISIFSSNFRAFMDGSVETDKESVLHKRGKDTGHRTGGNETLVNH